MIDDVEEFGITRRVSVIGSTVVRRGRSAHRRARPAVAVRRSGPSALVMFASAHYDASASTHYGYFDYDPVSR